MSDIAIKVENLSKQYRIGLAKHRQDTLRDTLADAVKGLNPRRRKRSDVSEETIWALKDVSFEVKHGEIVGIIGRNGAGKTTLLKILSRITEPTSGRAIINGRVGSLLEVGTGFHPELTGRENIYLNGAILGMRRVEIDRKFDEIVAFSEIEKLLDTPVKRYSSGMYVRLAFAVAANLEPEILLIDEVLAVGDVEFQKKCLGKMGDVAKEGRTVIVVSHNMTVIQRMCLHVVGLHNGKLLHDGVTQDTINMYLRQSTSHYITEGELDQVIVGRRGNGIARFKKIELLSLQGERRKEFLFGEPFFIRLYVQSQTTLSGIIWGFSFIASDGTEILGTTAHDSGITRELTEGENIFTCEINPQVLTPGQYTIRGAIFRPGILFESYDHLDTMTSFQIMRASIDLGKTPIDHFVGHVYIPYRWRNESLMEIPRNNPSNGNDLL